MVEWAAQQQVALIHFLFLGAALMQCTECLDALQAKSNLYFWVDLESLQVVLYRGD